MKQTPQRWCSFCGKAVNEVLYLFRGPSGIGICNECIAEAAGAAARQLKQREPGR